MIRIPILLLAGNPAPHSVSKDIYYAFETNGSEHRFWKVLRKLGFVDLQFDPESMRSNFFGLNYASPFRIGIEVAFTFPSSASAPSWSGVQGLQKLFGTKVLEKISTAERNRVQELVNNFFKNDPIIIIAVQKDAYSMFAQNDYSLEKAVKGELVSEHNLQGKRFLIYGVPPTRWMYTEKMQSVLQKIKREILQKRA